MRVADARKRPDVPHSRVQCRTCKQPCYTTDADDHALTFDEQGLPILPKPEVEYRCFRCAHAHMGKAALDQILGAALEVVQE